MNGVRRSKSQVRLVDKTRTQKLAVHHREIGGPFADSKSLDLRYSATMTAVLLSQIGQI